MKRRGFLKMLAALAAAPAATAAVPRAAAKAAPKPVVTTATTFQGYDVVPIVPLDTIGDTEWDWREDAGHWRVSRNGEVHTVKELVASTLKNARAEIADNISRKSALLNKMDAGWTYRVDARTGYYARHRQWRIAQRWLRK